MSMTVQEALTIMQLYGQVVTRDLVKQAYRKLASKYHPDKNPEGLRQMQEVNVAYDYLTKIPESSLSGAYQKERVTPNKRPEPSEYHLFRIKGLIVSTDDFSCKIWVSGKTFRYKELLKKYGFRWCPDERAWWRYSY